MLSIDSELQYFGEWAKQNAAEDWERSGIISWLWEYVADGYARLQLRSK
jgi:hypothetical protein